MVVISKSRVIQAGFDKVWESLVDWERERKFWSNVRDIRVLRSNEVTIEREATVGPRGFAQKTRQKVVLEPKKSIKLSFAGGQIEGERTILLVPLGKNQTRIDVIWDLQVDAPGFVEGIVQNQISKVTEDALKKIGESVESDGMHEEAHRGISQ